MAGQGGIQNVAFVLWERVGSSVRNSCSATGDDLVTSKQQEGKYGLGEILTWHLCLAFEPCTVT